MGWVGNIFIVIGLWLVGNKNRTAFIFTVIGESIWVAYAFTKGLYDLAFICIVFAVLAARNWYKWGQ